MSTFLCLLWALLLAVASASSADVATITTVPELVRALREGHSVIQLGESITVSPESWPSEPLTVTGNITLTSQPSLHPPATLKLTGFGDKGVQLGSHTVLHVQNLQLQGLFRQGLFVDQTDVFLPFFAASANSSIQLVNVTFIQVTTGCNSRPDYVGWAAQQRRPWFTQAGPDSFAGRLLDNRTYLVERARVPKQYRQESGSVVAAANRTAFIDIANCSFVCGGTWAPPGDPYLVTSRAWSWAEVRTAMQKGDSRTILLQANISSQETKASQNPLLVQDFREVVIAPAEPAWHVVLSLDDCEDSIFVGYSGELQLEGLTVRAPSPLCPGSSHPPAWYVGQQRLAFMPFGTLLPDSLAVVPVRLEGVTLPAHMSLNRVSLELGACQPEQFVAAAAQTVELMQRSGLKASLAGSYSLQCERCEFMGSQDLAGPSSQLSTSLIELLNTTITCLNPGGEPAQAPADSRGGKRSTSWAVVLLASLAAASVALLCVHLTCWLSKRSRRRRQLLAGGGSAGATAAAAAGMLPARGVPADGPHALPKRDDSALSIVEQAWRLELAQLGSPV